MQEARIERKRVDLEQAVGGAQQRPNYLKAETPANKEEIQRRGGSGRTRRWRGGGGVGTAGEQNNLPNGQRQG